jgi:hypothetical protein
MTKKIIWILWIPILILIIIAGAVYYFHNKAMAPSGIEISISPDCIKEWREKSDYCKQFPKDVCETKSFSLEYNQQINCSWSEVTSVCQAGAFCE